MQFFVKKNYVQSRKIMQEKSTSSPEQFKKITWHSMISREIFTWQNRNLFMQCREFSTTADLN